MDAHDLKCKCAHSGRTCVGTIEFRAVSADIPGIQVHTHVRQISSINPTRKLEEHDGHKSEGQDGASPGTHAPQSPLHGWPLRDSEPWI